MAETKQPTGADKAAPLTKAEQAEVRASDTADTSPRVATDTSGERVRAIFYGGGTTKEISKNDFKRFDIKHDSVVFDFQVDDATLAVDPKKGKKGLSREAADFLTENFPAEYEYIHRAEDNSEEG